MLTLVDLLQVPEYAETAFQTPKSVLINMLSADIMITIVVTVLWARHWGRILYALISHIKAAFATITRRTVTFLRPNAFLNLLANVQGSHVPVSSLAFIFDRLNAAPSP